VSARSIPDPEPQAYPPRPWALVATLMVGYIGIYLCRKNFAVANPLIRDAFGVNREQIGAVASYSTAAYTIGKFVFGPIIDRVGGRGAFLLSLLAVAVFGALGGMVSALFLVTIVYSLNRLAGSAGWGAMVKQVPDWFPRRSMALAMGVLSLSFVFGGVFATLLAGVIAGWSGNNWRWVMGGPSILVLLILVFCWRVLPRASDGVAAVPAPKLGSASGRKIFDRRELAEMAAVRGFWIVCALSFTLTLLRETFNVWTVDFFVTTSTNHMSSEIAAFLSTPFDVLGALGILTLGWLFGRFGKRARMLLLFAMLLALSVLILALPAIGARSVLLAAACLGLIGFLSYGPYSLLAGVLAVEIKGKHHVATVAGTLDGIGYLAAILSGAQFGRLVDIGGYGLGFGCLAGLGAISAVLCLFLYDRAPQSAGTPEGPTTQFGSSH
jgi:ACS family hexuronate transporter-like MFS transporter